MQLHISRGHALACVLLITFMFAGCTQGVKEYWKTSKRYYYEYINTPAEVDLELEEKLPAGVEAIGVAVPPIDAELRRFERTMFALDRNPDGAWMQNLVANHSWISGMALIDLEGNVVEQWPDTSLKSLDFKPIVSILPGKTTRLLRSYAQDTPMGPEVYVAVPILEEGVTARYFVAHFDPRELFSRAPHSAEIMVAAPDVLLWPGKFKADATPVVTEDWSSSIRRSTNGSIHNSTGEFFWVGRYLGTLPMAFAAPESGEFPVAAGQMDQYGGAGGFAGSLPPAGRWGAESEAGDRVILMEAAPPPPDFKGGQVNEAPLSEPEVQSAPPADSPSPKSAPPPPDTYKYRDGPDDGTHINKP